MEIVSGTVLRLYIETALQFFDQCGYDLHAEGLALFRIDRRHTGTVVLDAYIELMGVG